MPDMLLGTISRVIVTCLLGGLPAAGAAQKGGAPVTAAALAGADAAGYDAYHGRTVDEIERFLREARIVAVRPIGLGITKPLRVTLDDGRFMHDAAVQTVDVCEPVPTLSGHAPSRTCDSFRYNVAAYELGKLLGLTSIPPSVHRNFVGRPASFTWWIDEATTLAELEVRGLWTPAAAEWQRQRVMVEVYDELIANGDRHQANLIQDPLREVWLIDHTRAFQPTLGLQSPESLEDLHVDPALLARLRDLDAGGLELCCTPELDAGERAAVLARRDSIVARLH